MFLDFYKMKDQPFGVTPDPRFLYLGKSHREALASLYYAVESDRGFVALIAPPGLGKTTLIFQLFEKLQHASRTVFLFQTQCNSRELIHYVLNALGVDAQGMELVSMHNKLNEILCREMLAGRRFVLAIDEAQNLDCEVLETIRLLSNFETSQAKLLQIVLIGQPQLARKLADPELEQLRQRVSVFAGLQPLDPDDISRYIAHRLHVAGYEGMPLFTPGALRIVAEHSHGIPRKINSLCFAALSLACGLGRDQVNAEMMGEVIADRDVESLQRQGEPRRALAATSNSRPVLTVYPAEKEWSFTRRTLAAAGATACLAIVAGLFWPSAGRIERSMRESSDAWASLRTFEMFAPSARAPDPALKLQSPILNVADADVPLSENRQISASTDAAGLSAVVVQPGDTMRKIIIRTLGEFNGATIANVRKLNPEIANIDFLIAGETVWLPATPDLKTVPINTDGMAAIGSDPKTSRGE